MTNIEKIRRKVQRIRLGMAIGFGLYFIPILGAYFIPWLALLVPVGTAICVVAMVVALRSLRCPECNGSLGNLLLIKQSGKLFALPPDLAACPHCACELDVRTGHDDLVEILSVFERDEAYFGVIGAPMKGVVHRYELTLENAARQTFGRIMRLHPFGKHGGAYRYFFVPPPPREAGAAGPATIRIRVEKGTEDTTVEIGAPWSLHTLLDWVHQLQDPNQITQLSLSQA